MHELMYVVDRIKGEMLICENVETGEMFKFGKTTEVHEGDVIKIVNNKVVVDHEYTRIRKNRILDKVNRIEEKKVF